MDSVFIVANESGGEWVLPKPPQGWDLLGWGGTGWGYAPREYQFVVKESEEHKAVSEYEAVEYLENEMKAIMAEPESPVDRFMVLMGKLPVHCPDESCFHTK